MGRGGKGDYVCLFKKAQKQKRGSNKIRRMFHSQNELICVPP